MGPRAAASVTRKIPLVALLLLVLPAVPALALRQSSLADYTALLESLRALVERCQASAAACDVAQVGDDDRVTLQSLGSGANVNEFEARYDWLRETLKSASNAKSSARERDLSAALSRIDDALREAGAQPGDKGFAEARHRADSILGHQEFVTVKDRASGTS